ncbi:2,3-diphosphoglycerate-dependent phosphoglycerate mutase [Candidatus Daviesbacteria bacterium]|nr:2,3-diphosphoglycerate-dependent phosphoglycerate mutase [Candidatus Daviesbacteria bacterium]
MAYLVLVRHGESTWNAKGIWTGITDIELTEKGRQEARIAAKVIADINFQAAFVSPLKRSEETLQEMEKIWGVKLPRLISEAITERDYGDYTGKNKWQVKKEIGDEAFLKLRRSWDYPVPNGESLKQVYQRAVPYYQEQILPKLKMGKNVVVSAHGNSLRALVKFLDNISDADIANLEIPTGQVIVYSIDQEGKITSKEIRGPLT